MSGESSIRDRRSTRLSISIPVTISGVDANGQAYSEDVRTVIINKHGGKIATTRHLTMGTEILIENHAMGLVAKASVAWLSENSSAGDLHQVGVQLLDAQNIWGIAFPPDDWVAEQGTAEPPKPRPASTSGDAADKAAGPRTTSPDHEVVSNRVMQELRAVADACLLDFQDRLKQLTQQLGMELEFDLRARAFVARDREVGGMDEQIRILQQSLAATREELGRLEARMRELKSELQAATKKAPPTTAKEAQRQLTALSNSIVESMNRAAEEGLREYRSLLQRENQESAAKLRAGEGANPPESPSPSAKH
jgi:hypothetical protein